MDRVYDVLTEWAIGMQLSENLPVEWWIGNAGNIQYCTSMSFVEPIGSTFERYGGYFTRYVFI